MSQFRQDCQGLRTSAHLGHSEACHDLPPCSPVPSSVNNASVTRELSMNFDQFRNLSAATFREIAEA
jgi:hypothetical protein